MNTVPEFTCGIILLAAGGSRRMGRAKQLLPVKGKTLLRHVTEVVLKSSASPVVVVLGADSKKIEPTLDGLHVRLTVNPNWQEGMGSSVRVGLEAALEHTPGLQALLIVLADQPGLPAGHLDALITRYRQGNCTLVASHTDYRRVPPVLFGREWFPRLRTLSGDAGAREILRENNPAFASVDLDANTDLDTHEDYERYLEDLKP